MARRHSGVPALRCDATIVTPVRARFDQWVDSGSLLVVDAPLGFGKTLELTAWLDARDERVVWIAGGVVATTWAEAARLMLAGLAEVGVISGDAAERARASRAPFSVLAEATEPIVIVFDDIDQIVDFVELEELDAVCRQFPLVHIAITSSTPVRRDSSTADPDRTVVGRQSFAWDAAAVLEAADRQEVRALLPISPEEIIDAAGGRASAILNYIRDVRDGSPSITDFRSRWALERADLVDPAGGAKALLLWLSLFMVVTESMLKWSSIPNARELVALLEREGLVDSTVATTSNELTEYRVQRELQVVLEPIAAERYSAELLELHPRAVQYFSSKHRNAQTAYHLARSGEHEQAVELLVLPVGPLNSSDTVLDFRAALRAVEPAVLTEHPAALGMRVIFGHMPPLEPAAERSDAEMRLLQLPQAVIDNLSLRDQLFVTSALLFTLNSRGRAAEARVRGRELTRRVSRMPWHELRELVNLPGLLWVAQAEAELLDGHSGDAFRLAIFAREWTAEGTNAWAQYRAHAVAAAASAIEGSFELARQNADIAERYYTLAGWPVGRALYPLLLTRFILALSDLDPAALTTVAAQFTELSSGTDHFSTIASIADTSAKLFEGNANAAIVAAKGMVLASKTGGVPKLLKAVLDDANLDVLIATGKPGAAVALLDAAPTDDDHSSCHSSRFAAALIALGDARRALSVTDECVARASHHPRGRLASAMLARAAAKEALGLGEAADYVFAEALLLVLESPNPGVFIDLPAHMLESLWGRLELANPDLHDETRPLAERWAAIADKLPKQAATKPLSQRELQILGLLRTGATLQEIGEQLFVSANTVKTHTQSLYRKLGAANRLEALQAAQKLGISGASTQRTLRGIPAS